MKIRIIIVAILLTYLLVWFYKFQEQPTATFFPDEEITHTNIEQLQVHHIASNNNRVIDDPVAIKMFATKMKELNTNINETSDDVGKPIYHIYIVNKGRYPHPPIAVYKDSLVFHSMRRDMTTEESSSFFKVLEEIQKNSKVQGG